MQSRGHEGYVEIRTPGCDDAPLVLDYRSPTNPVRTDNMTTCAWQWFERTSALFAMALQFDGDGKTLAARAARLEAAGLYELIRGATQLTGSLLAPAVIKALAGVGIDFSVPVGELTDWLANPDSPRTRLSHKRC